MSDWIRLHDSEWTPEKITAEIANRSKAREVELGPLDISFPPFGYLEGMPQPPQDLVYNAYLYNHLRWLNEMEPLAIAPVLTDSPTVQTPWIGRVWERIRRQFHNLVLFYLNRSARKQNQLNEDLTTTLNELTRAIEVRREQIQPLRNDLSEQEQAQEEE